RGRAGAGRGTGDPAHGVGATVRLDRGAVDAFGDQGDRVVLLLDRPSDGLGDGRHVVDDRRYLLDGLSGVGGRRLNGTDLGGDVLGRPPSLGGERFDFGRDHGKASPS